MEKFDEVVSLGYNCEISFRIENYYGKINSWPFSWAYILDRDLFLDALDHMEDVFQGNVSVCHDSRVNSMVQCDRYKICFHPREEYVGPDGTILEDKLLPEGIDELRSRVSHLVEKFQKLLQNADVRTLFLVGITENGKNDDEEFIKKLHQKLTEKYLSGKFVLVVVIPKKRFKVSLLQLESETLKIRKIRKFGVQRCNDISTDTLGWAKIFGEFLGRTRLKQYYKNLMLHRFERIARSFCKRIYQLVEGRRVKC